MNEPELKLKEKVHRVDGTSWVLVKMLPDAFKPIALAVNASDRYFAGYEVHYLKRMPLMKRRIRSRDGPEIEVVYGAKWAWRNDKEFGHTAWHLTTLNAVYARFPDFEPFKEEISIKIDEIKKKLIEDKQP